MLHIVIARNYTHFEEIGGHVWFCYSGIHKRFVGFQCAYGLPLRHVTLVVTYEGPIKIKLIELMDQFNTN